MLIIYIIISAAVIMFLSIEFSGRFVLGKPLSAEEAKEYSNLNIKESDLFDDGKMISLGRYNGFIASAFISILCKYYISQPGRKNRTVLRWSKLSRIIDNYYKIK